MSADRQHEIELLTGRTIGLDRLDQFSTYGGLLAGHPHRETNRRIMDELVERHSDPEWSTAANLPATTCVAGFMSDLLPGDEEGIASMLSVIWFQDAFAVSHLP